MVGLRLKEKIRSTIVCGLAVFGSMFFMPALAHADPCEGDLPAAGGEFAGVVRHIIDGDGLCVGAVGSDASTWIEVRLGDFNAPELNEHDGPHARETLSRLTLGRPIECVGRARSYDRIIANCRVDGRAIGDLMRAARIREGGR
jgi:hypothetical protein